MAFLFNAVLNALGAILPYFGVLVLAWIAWRMWLHYIQQDFISGIDFVLLEIIPPREVLRSPAAMELFLTNGLYHLSLKGKLGEYWQGAVWFWFSLEIVSIEGQVHFYVRIPSRLKGLVETQIYSQYPQAQVRVADDYTLAVDEISEDSEWDLWGCEFGLNKREAYPIKTYVDYGLDKDPKEEFKIDPIAPVIELFGSIGRGEQMWMQIVIRPSKKKYKTKGTWFKHHDWVEEASLEPKNILRPYAQEKEKPDGTKYLDFAMRPPPFIMAILAGLDTKITKVGFDTGIRVCYVAKKTAFNKNNQQSTRLIFRQYANPMLNQFEMSLFSSPGMYGSAFNYPKWIGTTLSDRMLHEYRERKFFYFPLRHYILGKGNILFWPISPYIFPAYLHSKTFVLNTEELATLWHFPGQTLKVPTLERIESKESSPPTNLPS